jgi:hypothetical protein
MPKYLVTEVVEYIVEADDEEHAIEIMVQSEDINQFFHAVLERDAELITDKRYV